MSPPTDAAAGGQGGESTGGAGGVDAGADAGTVDATHVPNTCAAGQATASDVVVNLGDKHQNISGFGASTACFNPSSPTGCTGARMPTISSDDADTLWSTTKGAGLSLHRIKIDWQTGQTSELEVAKAAVAHGVKVWAAPWSPPPEDKTGASGTHGEVEGTLSNGQAYGKYLADFVSYMKSEGVDLYAISAQNEPDATVRYESCVFTGATMASFIGTYMGPALAGTGVKVIAPETQNWCGLPSFESAIMNDTNAAKYVSIIATHEYGCSPKAYPDIAKAGKEFWETEIYDQMMPGDPSIASGLRVAKLIHEAMTIASMSAWHYWWVFPASPDSAGLWDKATAKPSKRLWVEGNYARFVRPGFVRVGTSGAAPPTGVSVSAYTNPVDGTVAIVAINAGTSDVSLPIAISGAAACAFTPWVTSAADDLAAKTAIAASGGRFTASLAAQSVTTLVGVP